MKRLLLVEDDTAIQAQLAQHLRAEGFLIDVAGDAAAAEAAVKSQPDLILLDWQLPDGTGYDLLRRWRGKGLKAPVIFLTARADVLDKVVGLEAGADDYLTKPVEPRELVARIRARLRVAGSGAGPGSAEQDVLRAHGIELNRLSRHVSWKGAPVELTKLEFDLLQFFLENPNRVYSRDELLNNIWGLEKYPTTRTVDAHVARLRKAFDETLFESVRGVGYRFKG